MQYSKSDSYYDLSDHAVGVGVIQQFAMFLQHHINECHAHALFNFECHIVGYKVQT